MLTIPGKLAHVSSTRPNFHHQCGLTNLVRLVRALWRGLNRRPCSQPPSASICRSCLWFATFVVISRHIQTLIPHLRPGQISPELPFMWRKVPWLRHLFYSFFWLPCQLPFNWAWSKDYLSNPPTPHFVAGRRPVHPADRPLRVWYRVLLDLPFQHIPTQVKFERLRGPSLAWRAWQKVRKGMKGKGM